MKRSAEFSGDRIYRYSLTRDWGSEDDPIVNFIGLNPSTADEKTDDHTIIRCIRFAESWGYKRLIMTNLFAFRAVSPKTMLAHGDPIGHLNDTALINTSKQARLIIACWGSHGAHLSRDKAIIRMIPGLHYLILTKKGFPVHPLYLPKTLKPVLWKEARVRYRFGIKKKRLEKL